MPYFPIPDPPWIIPVFAGHEKLRTKKCYAILVPKPYKPSLLAPFPPFTQMRIRNKHTANMEEHQGARFPGLVQHGYPAWTSKLGGTEGLTTLLWMVPQVQKGADVKGKDAFRELTVRKTYYAPSAASRGRKGPPTGKILVQWPKHSLPPQGHSLFKGERELAFKGPERSAR